MKRIASLLFLVASICAGQSLSTVPIPTPIPNWGGFTGAGTIVTPTDFGYPICRLTDANTEFSFDGGQLGGNFSPTSSGANVDHRWNSNGTLLAIQRNGSTNSLLLSVAFNGLSCTVATKYSIPSGDVAFSAQATHPLIAYDIEGAAIKKYDFGETVGLCTLTAPCVTTVHDFASGTCLSGITATWTSVFLQSHSDTFFALGFSNTGGQGTGSLLATYLVGSGERVLNTGSATVAGIAPSSVCGDYGPPGVINMIGSNCPAAGSGVCGVCPGAVTCPDQFNLHEAYTSPNDATPWVAFDITASTCGNCGSDGDFTWLVSGLNVTAPSFGGHYAVGYSHIVANSNSPLGQEIIFQVVSGGALVWPITKFQVLSTSGPNNVPTPGTNGLDNHLAWQNVDANDTNSPYLTNTTYRTDSGNTINNYAASGEPPSSMPGIQCSIIVCLPSTNPMPGPFVNEVESFPLTNPPGSGTTCNSNPCTTLPITRIAHEMNDTVSFQFDASQATGVVSPDGRLMAFTSTDFCGVGDKNNDANLICGGPTWQKNNSTYVVGNLSSPLVGNAGNYTFQVSGCSGSCASGATQPTWPQIQPPIITAWSITSNVATFTATNTFTAGQTINLASFGTSTFFNSQPGTVLSAGLSGSQFEVNFTHANGSATESGEAQPTTIDNNITWAGLGAQNSREDVFAVLTTPVTPTNNPRAPVPSFFSSLVPWESPWPAK